jgi:hypothetical protein
MGKTIRASVLVLLLACSARADWMPNGSPAPPQQVTAAQEQTTGGEISTGKMPDDATGSWMQTALDLLAVLPSLL